MKIPGFNLFPVILILIISGCFGNSRNVLTENGNDKINIKSIAVLPVANKDADSKVAQLLRLKVFDEIYFKGYSKIPLKEIDNKLKSLYVKSDKEKKSVILPQSLKDALDADAGMYCTLTENNKSKIFYTPVKVSVICELRSSDNGDVIWKASSESTRRNFDFTDKRLERKLREDLEALIDEVVDEIIKTLPDGPNLRG
jgi:hypothetical protein